MDQQNPKPTSPPDHILQYFTYAHLPPHLQAISKPFSEMAHAMVNGDNGPESGTVTFGGPLPRNPERTVALRKLLEAKDAAVRAALAKEWNAVAGEWVQSGAKAVPASGA